LHYTKATQRRGITTLVNGKSGKGTQHGQDRRHPELWKRTVRGGDRFCNQPSEWVSRDRQRARRLREEILWGQQGVRRKAFGCEVARQGARSANRVREIRIRDLRDRVAENRRPLRRSRQAVLQAA